ncbi:MAG: benzoate-CoA ligase family protein [Alphaproteobacteria bacterium]|nr:benzoate-CoA ligase family protein [Alphaproteobacteria bacterium]
MADHVVEVDASIVPAWLHFPPVFNVAVPFVDRHLAEGRGGKVAIRTTSGEDVTYAALVERVNRAGNVLAALDLPRGARVLMIVKDCPAFFYVFWGAIKAGYVPVPLNTLQRAKDYAFVVDNARAACVLWSAEFAAEAEPALAAATHRPDYAMTTDAFMALMAGASAALAPAATTADEDCFWLYTSGSTGTPKGAVHAHRDMVVTSRYYAVATLGITGEDIHFSAAKLFFAYGLGNGMTFPLWTGGTAVLFDARPTPAATFEIITTYRPTVYYGVPTLYAAQLHAMESAAYDLSSLRHCVSAGESLPANLLTRWKEKTGLPILDGIGTTEILHIFIANAPGAWKAGTSGRLVPGYEAKIVGDDGEPVPQGEQGALWIRGGSVISRYWDAADRTEAAIRDGWIRTGDTYYVDADGYYVCCGRSDDMLKVGGIWCSPVEIEARLVAHPAVLEAAVVGRADADGLVKPEAWIVLKKGAAAPGPDLETALTEHCRAELARWKFPRWYRFVDDLPKTATGKIQRFRLRDSAT